MNRIDEIKVMRLQQENGFLDIDFIEQLARSVLNELVNWTNETIFKPLCGELEVSIPISGRSPNARAITYPDQPLKPKIEIELSLLIEIFKDALVFPVISELLAKEKDIDKVLDEIDLFKEQKFAFNGGLPEISNHLISNIPSRLLKEFSFAIADVYEKRSDHRIGKNEIYCRSLIFEFMLAWTFFHELGHIVQQHYIMKSHPREGYDKYIAISEMDDNSKSKPDIFGQAHEILADAEGLDLTFKYIGRTKRFHYVPFYLLLCAIGCMFQRFYRNYEENLELTNGQHPHPVIREEFAHKFSMKWFTNALISSEIISEKSEAALPLTYCSVRAMLFTGLYRSQRIEKFDGKGLPSYMTLLVEAHHKEKLNNYIKILSDAIHKQIPHIRELHLLSTNSLDLILDCLD